MAVEKIQVPDLGGADEVEVIEVLVKAGDEISENDSIIVLESDKAAMDIPAPKGGVVKEILVKVGDKVSQGSPILALESAGGAPQQAAAPKAEASSPAPEEVQAGKGNLSPEPAPSDEAGENAEAAEGASESAVREVTVPDLGGASDVEIIDILVKEGDEVKQEDGLITLETDKAAMDVPAPAAGKVLALKVKKGDKVSMGSAILDLQTAGAAPKPKAAPAKAAAPSSAPAGAAVPAPGAKTESAAAKAASAPAQAASPSQAPRGDAEVYAGPAVRKLARELGVDLRQVSGSGTRDRIVKEDVQKFVKSRLQGGASAAIGGGMGLPAVEDIDFSRFGEIEEVEMSKLHQVTAVNMSRAWLNVPHVTQFDEADVSELENFREAQKRAAEKKGLKLTPLPFIIKACALALREHPQFNVALHSSGKKLIRKKYVHIGVAVATPAGLMVPVVRDADRKSIWDIAREVAELGDKAKERRLSREQMEGACFTVSSLGNIGGTGFTPIVNTPEVAILGVSRTTIKPVYIDGQFVPRKMLPFSLSYDHRAVNGVDGGLFCTTLAALLGDIRLMAM